MNGRSDWPLCQQSVDTKGFKGKGGIRAWISRIRVRRQAVHLAMDMLHEATRQVTPRYFYLELHARSATGSISLRWRRTDGRHCLWQDVEPHLQGLPKTMQDWYRRANEEAEILNAMEQAVRAEQRAAWILAEKLGLRLGGNVPAGFAAKGRAIR